jgi:CubicO group peptidase (beta-lactamase class C family)
MLKKWRTKKIRPVHGAPKIQDWKYGMILWLMEKVYRNVHKYKAIFWFGFLILFGVGCSLPPKPFIPDSKGCNNYQEAIRYSHKYLEQLMKKNGTIGMSVAVIDSDKVVFSEGFGFSDKEANKKTTDSTTFMIGSTSKLFTETAIMQLVEQGKVALDSPITTYLPNFKVISRFKARPITIKDLLTHESGLPSDIINGFCIGQHANAGHDTLYRMLPTLCANENVTFPPRTVFSYSNIGIALLGCIIEQASKRNYSEYITDSIFAKLNMNHSAVGFESNKVKGEFSKGYFGKKQEDPLYIRDVPAGSIVTSVKDLSLFVKMLFADGTLNGNHILDKYSLDQMWSPQNSDIPLDFWPFGLGYFLFNPTRISGRFAQHGGDIPPYHAMLTVLPDLKIGVIVLVNSEQGAEIPTNVRNHILETFYEAKTGRKLPEPQFSHNNTVKLSKQRLQELSGFYQTKEGTVKADIKGQNIVFSFFGTPVRLIPQSDSIFTLQYRLLGCFPIPIKELKAFTLETHTIGERQIVLLRMNGLFTGIMGEKFVPEIPPREWIERVGTYEMSNGKKPIFTGKETEKRYQQTDFTIAYDSKEKNLIFNGIPLKVLSATEAVTRGIGRNAGEMVRIVIEDGKEYLWVYGYALKRKPISAKH